MKLNQRGEIAVVVIILLAIAIGTIVIATVTADKLNNDPSYVER
jgi:DNA-binding IscR family transcriptional regulator